MTAPKVLAGTVGFTASGPFGSNLVGRDYVTAGVPVIRGQNMNGRWVSGEFAFVSEDKANQLSSNLAYPGDVVFTQRGTLGQVSVVPAEPYDRYVLSQSQMKLAPDPSKADSLFLYYVFRSEGQQGYIQRNAVQSGVPHTNLAFLRSTPIRLPIVSEQRAIADVLGVLDDKIELNRRMNDTLAATSALLYSDQFESGDQADRELGDFADIVDCLHSKKPERQQTGLPLLQLNNIRDDGLIDLGEVYAVSESDYVHWTSRMEAREGDCVITNVGRVGAVAQIPPGVTAALGRNMTGVRCKAEYPYPTFVLVALLSRGMRAEIERRTDAGTILSALNVRSIPKLRLPSASQDVLRRFEERARPLRARMELNLVQSRTLAELRDTLLPKLISGELRVRHAEAAVEHAT